MLNELTSRETLQEILDRRDRDDAISAAATIAAAIVVAVLSIAFLLGIAPAPPFNKAAAADAELPAPSLEGLRYSP